MEFLNCFVWNRKEIYFFEIKLDQISLSSIVVILVSSVKMHIFHLCSNSTPAVFAFAAFLLVPCRVTHLCFPVPKILLLASFVFPPATKMPRSPLSDDSLDLMDCKSIPPTPEKMTNFKIPKLSSSLSSQPTPAQWQSKSSFGSKPPRSRKTKPTKPGHHHQTKPTKPGDNLTKLEPEKIFLTDGSKKIVWASLGKNKQIKNQSLLISERPHPLTQSCRCLRYARTSHNSLEVQPAGPSQPSGTASCKSVQENLMKATADFLVSDRVPTLDKKAEDLAQVAQTDFSKILPYYDFGPRKMLYQNVKHRPTKYQAGLLLLHFILNIQAKFSTTKSY